MWLIELRNAFELLFGFRMGPRDQILSSFTALAAYLSRSNRVCVCVCMHDLHLNSVERNTKWAHTTPNKYYRRQIQIQLTSWTRKNKNSSPEYITHMCVLKFSYTADSDRPSVCVCLCIFCCMCVCSYVRTIDLTNRFDEQTSDENQSTGTSKRITKSRARDSHTLRAQ